ncbi:hypothetical protein OYC64_006146 [Pagothenia borchgrevinki]|uniref:Uncharacterized protein n=1 Tax=Pagothenia borchgrevinki TaxID=8213 RepID=A0ABD2GI39_PAGBO
MHHQNCAQHHARTEVSRSQGLSHIPNQRRAYAYC